MPSVSHYVNTRDTFFHIVVLEQENGRGLSALHRDAMGAGEHPDQEALPLTPSEICTLQRASARAYAQARVYMEIY
jgi:hypothetical protein